MTKLSLFGVDQTNLIDCTAALPPPKDGNGGGFISGGGRPAKRYARYGA